VLRHLYIAVKMRYVDFAYKVVAALVSEKYFYVFLFQFVWINPQEEKPKIEWDKSMCASNNSGIRE
jgi:hypothetical protein